MTDFQNVSFPHGKTVDYSEITALQDEIQDTVNALESDIEELEEQIEEQEEHIEDFKNDMTDEHGSQLSEMQITDLEQLEEHLKDLQSDLENKQKEFDSWNQDLELIDEIINELSQDETLISDDYFDEYAEDFIKEVYDLREVPSIILNNVDWQNVASDLKQDYTEIDIENVTYHYIYH